MTFMSLCCDNIMRMLLCACRFFVYLGYLLLLHQMGIALFR
jgi:hypothetical protein